MGRGTRRAAPPFETTARECVRSPQDEGRQAAQGEGGEGAPYVSVKLNSPSFSIEVTTLSPALSQACLSLG